MGLKFLDLFSGIGGFRLGMERAGHTCIGHVEIDKYANISYQAIHQPKEEELFHDDITTLPTEFIQRARARGVDVLCGGFPCQAFSIAGKRHGFRDTRGTLFFHIAKLAREIQPAYLFLENVRGLLSHDGGDTFETILRTLDDIGYDAEWEVLNSKDFGVPQNRERVFIIGHLRGSGTRQVFPIGRANGENPLEITHLADWTGTNRHSGQRIYSIEGLSHCLTTKDNEADVPKFAIPVLTPDRVEKRQNGRRVKEEGDPMFTLTAQDRHGVLLSGVTYGVSEAFRKPPLKGLARTLTASKHNAAITDGFRIRKLTPRECWRLQGFPDWAFDRAKEAKVSDSQLYKQAGNSVTVNVIEAIARELNVEDRDHGQD